MHDERVDSGLFHQVLTKHYDIVNIKFSFIPERNADQNRIFRANCCQFANFHTQKNTASFIFVFIENAEVRGRYINVLIMQTRLSKIETAW